MAVSSPLNIKKLTDSANQSKVLISFVGRSLGNISKTIFKNTKVKSESFKNIKDLKTRRFEFDRRQQLEDELKSPRTVTNINRGPQELIQKTGVGGFFDRVLGFLGYLTAGWLLNNLPTLIGMAKEFIARLKKAGEILSQFFTGTIKLFGNMGDLLKSVGQNILSFDFFDTSNRVKNSMSELTDTANGLMGRIGEAFGLITTPLTEGKYSGEEIPGTGTQSTNEGAYVEPPAAGAGVSGGNSDFWTLVAVAALEDGDPQGQADVAQSVYNRLASGAYSGRTIRELIIAEGQYQPTWDYPRKRNDRKPNPEWINISDAESAAKAANLKVGTIKSVAAAITNPTLQKKASEFVQGRTDFKGANSGFPGGIQRKSGDNYFGWQYNYKGRKIASVPNFGVTGGSSQQSQTQIEQVPVRKITPIVGEGLGAGRNHGGRDLLAKEGTPLRAVSDGVIVDSDFERGWGNFLVMKDDRGIYHLYGHMQDGYKRRGPVKKGEVIGKVGMTGRTTGPHLHWETGTAWNGGVISAGRFDPLNRYSKFAPFNTQPTSKIDTKPPAAPILPPPTPAQVSPPPSQQQRQGVPSEITPDRTPQNIIVYQPPSQNNVVVSSNSQASPTYVSIDEIQLLNTFMKNKLLLDLAYL